MKKIKAVYAGSFDPVTLGHEDIIRRASRIFDKVTVAIGINPKKTPLFSLEERIDMLKDVADQLPNVEVDSFQDLLIDYCMRSEAQVVVRGLRAVSDFEQELMLAHANGDLSPGLETVWLPTKTAHSFVSSTMVREIASHGGTVNHYVSASVASALRKKFPKSP